MSQNWKKTSGRAILQGDSKKKTLIYHLSKSRFSSLLMIIVTLVNYRKHAVFLRIEISKRLTEGCVKCEIGSKIQIFMSKISKNKIKK